MNLQPRDFLLALALAGAAARPTWGQSVAPSVAPFGSGAQSATASCRTRTIDERYRCLSRVLSDLLTHALALSAPTDKSSACASMDEAEFILQEMTDLIRDADAYKSDWEKRSTAYTTVASKYYARFDAEKTVTLTGTVKELLPWTSPALIVLTLVNGEGEAAQEWAIEMNGLDGVVRERPTTLTPGMQITLTIHPLREGTNGGLLLTVVLPDGKQMNAGRDRPLTAQDFLDSYAGIRRTELELVKTNRQILGCSP